MTSSVPADRAVLENVLCKVACASRDTVLMIAQEISAHIDAADAGRNIEQSLKWRELSRVVDSMAALRFPDWAKDSPAQKRDLAVYGS